MNPRNRTGSGFTLLELILVMIILAIAAAMVVPSLRTFAIGRQTDNAITTVLSLSNYARVHSISEGRTFRLNFDPQGTAMWLTAQNGGVYEAPHNDYGQRFEMPDGVKLDVMMQPMPNTQLVVPVDVQQTLVTPVVPYGQPLAESDTVVQNQHGPGTYMEYQPSGRVDPIHIRLTDKLGRTVDLGCQSTTETIHVLTAAEMQ